MYLLRQVTLRYNELTLSIAPAPKNIGSYFSEEVCRKSFSGNTTAEATELDYFFLLKSGEDVVGFFRAIDLFFDSEIELHGSYGYKDQSHMRSYFVLSRMFVATIFGMFPDRQVTTVVNKKNKRAVHYVEWLGFVGVAANRDSADMVNFILDEQQYRKE